MKKILSDYIKSQDHFERFCNMFLKKEVSPLVKVYDAPGSDSGIDAEYRGLYAGKSGHWIFQFKFSDPTMDKKRARSQLFSALKGDGRKKQPNGEFAKADTLKCDNYVLITNIHLTAGNKRKFENVKEEKGYTFTLTCWDAEDLIAITLGKFPYLLKPPHLSVFLPWQDMFRDEVAGKKPLLRYDYETFGREDEVHRFENFLQDSDRRLLVMYGSGGIGKTKLAIEFAKTVERNYKDYDPLFVRVDAGNFENVLKDIIPSRKYIFFIDNAHDFSSDFGNLKALLNSEDYRESKAVLITRKPFKTSVKESFLSDLPDGAVDEREVPKLPREKTEEFIQKYIKEPLPKGLLLAGLTRIGRDIPLIAVMVIDALNNRRDLRNLTETELIEFMFESYLPDSDNPRRRLLNWLSGIAPIDVENRQILDKLAELLKVESYEIEWYRDDLLKAGLLLQAGKKQRVYPDPLSDYILGRACFLSNQRPSSFHERLLEEFLPILPVNVITNLARVENVTGDNSLLDVYVASLKSQARDGDNAVREGILEHIEGICYFRPDDATEIFNIILDNPNSEDYVRYPLGVPFTLTHQHLAEKIAKEVSKTIYTLSGFSKTLEIIKKLLLMKDLDVPNYDSPRESLKKMTSFQTNKPGVFQDKVLETFEMWKEEDEPDLTLVLLNSLNSLLVLDFNETVSRGISVEFGWHHLQYTPELIQLRAKAIALIKDCLGTSAYSIVRARAIGSISRAINPLGSPFRREMTEKDKIVLQEEQVRLFNIIANQIQNESDFTVLNAIDQCLNEYAENTHLEGFPKERAAELQVEFGRHKDYERYLFYRQFTGKFQDWKMSERSEKTQEFLEKYLEKYTPARLSELMRECVDATEKWKEYSVITSGIWDEGGWNPGSATFLLQDIGELDPTYGFDLLDYIVAWQIPQSHCASGLLRGIRLSDKDKAQVATHRLLGQSNNFANRIIVKSYLWTNKAKQCIGKRDLEFLDQLSELPDSQLRVDIAEGLPCFYGMDTARVLEILAKLSTDESSEVMRKILCALDSKKFEFSAKKHLEKYKQIVYNCLGLEHFYSEFEEVLHTISKYDLIWVIRFFEERIIYEANAAHQNFNHLDRSIDLSGYDAVPHRPHYLFRGINWNDRSNVEALKRVRNWVLPSTEGLPETPKIISPSSNIRRFKAPILLVSMVGGDTSPGDEVKINGTMKKLFEEWINSEDIELMRGVAYLIKYFDVDEALYSLAESLVIKSKGDKQVKSGITTVFWSKVDSRNIGQPSPYFKKRIEELKAWRDKTQSQDVAKFANDLIEMMQQEIERQLQEDEEFLDAEGC